jgi:protoporphyrinogen/coproporphyrinogen III oxidase
MAMAVAAFGLHRSKTMTVAGGIGRIPAALAANLDVRTATPAVRVERGARGIVVATGAGELEAEHAIVAVPAHVARDLLGDRATPAEAELLATTYSTTISVCLGLAGGYRLPAAIRDIYGFFVPARERERIAAVSIERNKSPDRTHDGELLVAFLTGDAGERLLGQSDGDVLAAVLPELERWMPGLSDAVTMTHLIRWAAALPRSPVGRARAVAAYRRIPRPDRSLLLAGDYAGSPWTDGAADTGEWAAAELIAHYRNQPRRQRQEHGRAIA